MRAASKDELAQLQRAYCIIPDEVVKDLEQFCRANESCWHPDPRVHAALEGRREVILRILDHRNLTEEQFLAKYKLKELPDG